MIGTRRALVIPGERCNVGQSSDGCSRFWLRLTINIKAPPPANFFRQHASDDRSNGTGQSPHHAHHAKICAAIAHAEEITDADIDQDNEASATDALDGSSRDQHANVDAGRRQQAAQEEDGSRNLQDGFPAPDVGELAPGRHGRGIGEQVRGADPGVAGIGVEVLADGGEGGVMIVMSSAARKTDAQSDAMMIVVCSFVRDASGSAGGAAFLGTTSPPEGSSVLVAEPFSVAGTVVGEAESSTRSFCSRSPSTAVPPSPPRPASAEAASSSLAWSFSIMFGSLSIRRVVIGSAS